MGLSLLPREAQLVLLSAADPSRDAEILRLLESELRWPMVVNIASREGAAAILWQRLKALRGEALLPRGADSLRGVAMLSEFRQRFIEQRLSHTLEVLGEARVRVVLLKGAALGLTVYGSLERRPMGDIDLLVDPEHAGEAHRLLLARGWRASRYAVQESFYGGHHHLPPLDDAGGSGVELELHTDLFFVGHPFDPLAALVREGAEPLAGTAPTLRVPRLSHHLLYICLHFGWSHLFAAGAWRTFRDLRTIIASPALDWDELTRVAHRTRAVTSCYWTLRLARTLVGVDVPAEVLAALHPKLPAGAFAMLERHLTSQLLPTIARCPSLRLTYLAWGMAIRPGWSGHGKVRPWDRNLHFQREPRTGGEEGSYRLLSHLRNARGWGEYLAVVLPGPTLRRRSRSARSAGP